VIALTLIKELQRFTVDVAAVIIDLVLDRIGRQEIVQYCEALLTEIWVANRHQEVVLHLLEHLEPRLTLVS
jgi:hypothetical protein